MFLHCFYSVLKRPNAIGLVLFYPIVANALKYGNNIGVDPKPWPCKPEGIAKHLYPNTNRQPTFSELRFVLHQVH